MAKSDSGKYPENWTVRDEFAARAMQGFLARTAEKYGGCSSFDGLTYTAYLLADAMIAEREKSK